MNTVDYFASDKQEHWLGEIGKCDWAGGAFLYELLSQGTFFDNVGERSKLLLLTDGDELVSFCTYAEKDDIQPTELTPWVGFVYTFPAHRGHRRVGILFDEIERLAEKDGVDEVYISTNHVGLYEKYGCEFYREMQDIHGEPSRVYVKRIKRPLKTERLLLRRWLESDADDLFMYATDPDVGPAAGWAPHKSVEESRSIIKDVFSGAEAYAICLKTENRPIGTIELKLKGRTDMTERDDECELSYWLGKPYWGKGLMTEAVGEMLRHAFEDIGMTKVWCGYYDGNTRSRRVQEKAGMTYQWTTEGLEITQLNEIRTGHVNAITKEEWRSRI